MFRELQREKIWSRIHLVPLLLAEGDRDAYRREQAALAREKEIMKNVTDWEVREALDSFLIGSLIARVHWNTPELVKAGKSVYNNPRYRSPEYIVVL